MDSIDLLLYMPASFVCDKCGFCLENRVMIAATGQVGIKAGGEDPEPCPNDGEQLRRVTWKEAYENSRQDLQDLMAALIESVKLQSHYAKLLNIYDGGQRMQFQSVGEWMARLTQTGTIPKRVKNG
jgi:hypothetical protein